MRHLNFYSALVAHVLFVALLGLAVAGKLRLECDKLGRLDVCRVVVGTLNEPR